MWASRQMTWTFNPPVNEPEAPTGRNCNTSEPQPRHIATPLQLAIFPYGTHSPPMWRRLTLSRPSRVSWQGRLYHSRALLTCVILLWRPADYTTRTEADTSTAAPFCWLSTYPYDPDDRRFRHASRRKLCEVKRHFDKWYQFVTNCLYHQTIYIPSIASVATNFCYVFIRYEFCRSIAQSNPDNLVVENWHTIYFFINLHNTADIIIIIKWNVLFVEKNIFGDFFVGSRISDRRHVNTVVNSTENAMSSTDIFISIWFDVCLWFNISKTMLLWNGLLVLFVLLAGFPWNMARPQLRLLSLTVKKLRCQASNFILRAPKPPI